MRAGVDAANRTAVFILGFVLATAGVLGLVLGFGGFGSGSVDDPVIPQAWRGYAGEHAWVWWALVVVSLLVAYLGLRWLLAQLRTDRVHRVDLTSNSREGLTIVHAGAVGEAVAADVGRIPGVARAAAHLAGPAPHRLHVSADLTDRADLAQVRQQIEDGVVPNARKALGEPQLPVRVELRLLRARAANRGLS